MKGMEMMLATVLQQMGVNPAEIKAAGERAISEIQNRMIGIDNKLESIRLSCDEMNRRLVRLEIESKTIPSEDVIESAKMNGLLLGNGV